MMRAANTARFRASRAWLAAALLLAYVAMLAHGIGPDHVEADTCAVCIAAERFDDSAHVSANDLPPSLLGSPAGTSRDRSVAPAEVPVAASRSPPLPC